MRGLVFSFVFLFGTAETSFAQNTDIRDRLFSDPTNIEINLAYLQQQLASQNFKGAAATLQRVLLLDPNSRLAKVLYAEVQIRLGNLADAKSILVALLKDNNLSIAMREKAELLLGAIEKSENRFAFSGSASVSVGSADNALAAPKGPQVQFYNALFENNSPNVAEAFSDFSFGFSMNYKLPTYVERDTIITFGVAGRNYADMNSADSTTSYLALNFNERRFMPWGLSYSAAITEIDGDAYNVNQQISMFTNRPLGKGRTMSGSVRVGETRHFTFAGSSTSKTRDGTSSLASLSYSQPARLASQPWLLSINLGGGANKAQESHYGNSSTSVVISARTRFAGISFASSLDFVTTEFDAADPFIGDDIREDERSRMSLSASYQLPETLGGSVLSLSGFAADTRSNLPNFTKTVSELKFSINQRF
jgi:tetratricopeptide (TPR) repeat protein